MSVKRRVVDKRVESMQVDVDEIVRLRRENEEAVRVMKHVRDGLKSRQMTPMVAFKWLNEYLAKREEG